MNVHHDVGDDYRGDKRRDVGKDYYDVECCLRDARDSCEDLDRHDDLRYHSQEYGDGGGGGFHTTRHDGVLLHDGEVCD